MPQDFDPLFVVRLAYHDPDIPVDRVKACPAEHPPISIATASCWIIATAWFVEVTAASRANALDLNLADFTSRMVQKSSARFRSVKYA